MSVSSTVIVGRLTRDAEVTTTQSGITLAKFSVAVDRYGKNPQTGEKETDFYNCTAWRKTAEFIQNYVGKGREVVCQGRMQARKYPNKNYPDVTMTVWELVVDNIQPVGPRPEGADVYEAPAAPAPPAEDGPDESDPFA